VPAGRPSGRPHPPRSAAFGDVHRILQLSILVLYGASAFAQDLRTLSSPNGQIEFRVFVAARPGEEARLAYQVSYRGKPLVNTSLLGLEIRDQIVLGEKLGLINSKTSTGDGFRSLTLDYMQNGSLGRLLNLEVRAYDQGIAFRYIVPKSPPVDPLLIENEGTEFSFAADTEHDHKLLSQIPEDAEIPLPFVANLPGLAWVSIAEIPQQDYPRMFLTHSSGTTLISSLPALARDPKLALESRPPLTTPWRILLVGPSRESVMDSGIIGQLSR
jgi:alpha-glucosidase